MGLFQRKQAVAAPERRVAKRHPCDCPARLTLLGGDCEGRLSDLSEVGARFETANPPAEGVSGLLAWNGHEFFGKVAWANDDCCGVVFERPIPMAVLQETVQRVDKPSGPVADFGNIPIAPRGRWGLIAS